MAGQNVDWLGAVISLGTWYPWPFQERISHFGIVADYGTVLSVYESTADPDLGLCRHADKAVVGVQCHDAGGRMQRHANRGGRAWRLRPNPWIKPDRDDLQNESRRLLGTGYDFWGAWGARSTRIGRRPDPNAERLLYCSEFVLLVFQRLSLLPDDMSIELPPKAAARLLVERGVCSPPEEIEL